MKEVNEENSINEPTKSELEILQVLWENGPSTVRYVNDVLNSGKKAVQYTSTLKLMQVMLKKNLLTRDESSMQHTYMPAEEEQKTKNALLDRFVDSMYNGSASKLLMQLLGNKKTSETELNAMKNLLKELDKE